MFKGKKATLVTTVSAIEELDKPCIMMQIWSKFWSVWVAVWLAFLTKDPKVQGLNPSWGGIQLITSDALLHRAFRSHPSMWLLKMT